MPTRSSKLVVAAALAAALAPSACVNPLADLSKLFEARRLASDLRVAFTEASEASNRAVMADTDEASRQASDEARQARHTVEQDMAALRTLLDQLRYADEQRYLAGFAGRYDEYRGLDDEILPLAVENTNLKAQRLSFGESADAARAFESALDAAVHASAGNAAAAEALASRARIAVLEIQVLQAPHIAEADDAAMTRLEARMAASATAAHASLDALKHALPPSAASQLAAAAEALDRFLRTNSEIVALSRRNTNVRSLALSLGRKRVVTAECEDQLAGLTQALARHESTATR